MGKSLKQPAEVALESKLCLLGVSGCLVTLACWAWVLFDATSLLLPLLLLRIRIKGEQAKLTATHTTKLISRS